MSTQLTPVVRGESEASTPEPDFPPRYVRFGDFQVDLQREELYQGGERVKVQAQVYRALLLLLRRAGEIISREEVRQWLWPDVFLTNLDANVNTTINKLRLVLGDSPENPRYVETLPRRGYSFIAAVHFSEQAATQLPGDSAGALKEVAPPETLAVAGRQGFREFARMASFLIAGVVLGALLTFVWFFVQAKAHGGIASGKAVVSGSLLEACRIRA